MISNYFSDICGGNGYIRLLSNVCVKLSRVNCTLQEAASYCSRNNATLFHIGTSDKYYSILYLIKSMSGTFVIQDINILFIFIVLSNIFHFPWPGVLDTTLWNKVCQWPAECYSFSLCTYTCHFPWSGVLDTTLWKTRCISDLRNVTRFLCVLIFFTSHGQVYSMQPYEWSVSVTCEMLLVFSLYLYVSLSMAMCTRYKLMQ